MSEFRTGEESLSSILNPDKLSEDQKMLLLNVLKEIFSGADRRSSLWNYFRMLSERYGWERITLYRFTPDDSEIEAWLSSDADLQWQASLSSTLYPELLAVKKQGHSIHISRISQEIFIRTTKERIKRAGFVSLHVEALTKNGECWGCLEFKSATGHNHLEDDLQVVLPVLKEFANHLFCDKQPSPVAHFTIQGLYNNFIDLFKRSAQGYAVLSHSGTLVDVGGKIIEVLGYSRDQIVGEPVVNYIAPDDHLAVMEHIRIMREKSTEIVQLKLTLLDLEGNHLKVIASAMSDPMQTDRILLTLNYVHEDNLAYFFNQFKAMLKKLIWDAPNFVYITGSDSRFLAVNKALCDATGYTEQEFQARDFSGIMAKEEEELSKRRIERLEKGEEILPLIGHFQTRSSDLIPVEIRVHAIMDDEKNVVAIMGIARDLRAFIASREREEHLREELNRQIEHLSIANMRLADEKEYRYTFISSAAHNLKTPIATVKACLETLISDIAPTMDREINDLFDPAWQSINRVEELVNDLLELAGLQSQEVPLDTETIHVQNLAQDLNTIVTPLYQKAGASLTIEMERDDLILHTDRSKITQVLDTLLTNALHAAEQGEVVRFHISETDEMVTFQVINPGSKLPEEKLNTIFLPFVNSPRRDGRHGLGLALAKAIVEALGGKIDVASSEDIGTKFIVSIPHHEIR